MARRRRRRITSSAKIQISCSRGNLFADRLLGGKNRPLVFLYLSLSWQIGLHNQKLMCCA
jgi:hypothetical protein